MSASIFGDQLHLIIIKVMVKKYNDSLFHNDFKIKMLYIQYPSKRSRGVFNDSVCLSTPLYWRSSCLDSRQLNCMEVVEVKAVWRAGTLENEWKQFPYLSKAACVCCGECSSAECVEMLYFKDGNEKTSSLSCTLTIIHIEWGLHMVFRDEETANESYLKPLYFHSSFFVCTRDAAQCL